MFGLQWVKLCVLRSWAKGSWASQVTGLLRKYFRETHALLEMNFPSHSLVPELSWKYCAEHGHRESNACGSAIITHKWWNDHKILWSIFLQAAAYQLLCPHQIPNQAITLQFQMAILLFASLPAALANAVCAGWSLFLQLSSSHVLAMSKKTHYQPSTAPWISSGWIVQYKCRGLFKNPLQTLLAY